MPRDSTAPLETGLLILLVQVVVRKNQTKEDELCIPRF